MIVVIIFAAILATFLFFMLVRALIQRRSTSIGLKRLFNRKNEDGLDHSPRGQSCC